MDYTLINGYIVHLVNEVVGVHEGKAHITELVPAQCEDGNWTVVWRSRQIQIDESKFENKRPLQILAYLTKITGKGLTLEARNMLSDLVVLKKTLKKGSVWPHETASRLLRPNLRTVVALGLLKEVEDGYEFFI